MPKPVFIDFFITLWTFLVYKGGNPFYPAKNTEPRIFWKCKFSLPLQTTAKLCYIKKEHKLYDQKARKGNFRLLLDFFKMYHWPLLLQTSQGSFFSLSVLLLHTEVGVSLISPSFIRLFRDFSKMFNVKDVMQHLKKPPFFLQSLANLDCSWRRKVLINPKFFVTGTYVFCTLLETLCVVCWI